MDFTPTAEGYLATMALSSTPLASLPANYRVVAEVIEAAGPGSHLSAHDVWLRARARQPRLGFATVHRALARLCDEADVLKIDVPGAASAFYEPAAQRHAHFRCTVCGAVVDVDFVLPRETIERIARDRGFEITSETISFNGRCTDCTAADER